MVRASRAVRPVFTSSDRESMQTDLSKDERSIVAAVYGTQRC